MSSLVECKLVILSRLVVVRVASQPAPTWNIQRCEHIGHLGICNPVLRHNNNCRLGCKVHATFSQEISGTREGVGWIKGCLYGHLTHCLSTILVHAPCKVYREGHYWASRGSKLIADPRHLAWAADINLLSHVSNLMFLRVCVRSGSPVRQVRTSSAYIITNWWTSLRRSNFNCHNAGHSPGRKKTHGKVRSKLLFCISCSTNWKTCCIKSSSLSALAGSSRPSICVKARTLKCEVRSMIPQLSFADQREAFSNSFCYVAMRLPSWLFMIAGPEGIADNRRSAVDWGWQLSLMSYFIQTLLTQATSLNVRRLKL